jgi:hypothetical protein
MSREKLDGGSANPVCQLRAGTYFDDRSLKAMLALKAVSARAALYMHVVAQVHGGRKCTENRSTIARKLGLGLERTKTEFARLRRAGLLVRKKGEWLLARPGDTQAPGDSGGTACTCPEGTECTSPRVVQDGPPEKKSPTETGERRKEREEMTDRQTARARPRASEDRDRRQPDQDPMKGEEAQYPSPQDEWPHPWTREQHEEFEKLITEGGEPSDLTAYLCWVWRRLCSIDMPKAEVSYAGHWLVTKELRRIGCLDRCGVNDLLTGYFGSLDAGASSWKRASLGPVAACAERVVSRELAKRGEMLADVDDSSE